MSSRLPVSAAIAVALTLAGRPALSQPRQTDAYLDETRTRWEGVAKRIQRYKKMATLIRERLAKLGIKPVLPPDRQSNSITAYHLPEGLAYQTLHDRLKTEGYVIYAGQGNLETKIFRIANMGALTEAQFTAFLDAFEQVCRV